MNGQQQIQPSNSPEQQQGEAEVIRLINQSGLGKRETEYGKDGIVVGILGLIMIIVFLAFFFIVASLLFLGFPIVF